MSVIHELDLERMARCRELARRAGQDGNQPIGALVAVGGEVLAEAEEQTPAGPLAFAHAELLAVQRAISASGRRRLPEATLYSTHEPCFLCSYALRAARIGRVVIESAVPEIGGATSRYPILTADDILTWGPPPVLVWVEPPSPSDGPRHPGPVERP